MDPDTYCRDIEAYLCRKNEGHLVRVVGPAFNVVSGWVAQGVPFKVACRGIDRYFERYYAKGPRRRPIRVEFCEADVLDVFDEWRRAVGIGMAGSPPASPVLEGPSPPDAAGEAQHKPGQSLRAHLDRVVTRLTDLQARGGLAPGVEVFIEHLIERLGKDRESSRSLRGEARRAYLAGLERLDGQLIDEARTATLPETLAALREEAAEELAGFRSRMPPEAYERAVDAATTKLLRDRLKLPAIAYRQG